MQADTDEQYGLNAADSARAAGMSRRSFDEAWKGERAPQPSRPFEGTRNPRWSRDEIRCWVAFGYPPLERWRPIWRSLLESGAWAPKEVVVRVVGPNDAA